VGVYAIERNEIAFSVGFWTKFKYFFMVRPKTFTSYRLKNKKRVGV